MKKEQFSNVVLSDKETLLLLEGFCYEALRFLKLSKEQYPKLVIGVAFEADGKANPIFINYDKSKVFVLIPILRKIFVPKVGNDAPTLFRMMGYQIARFWQRFILTGCANTFDSRDEDSVVFAYALMMIKGILPNVKMPNRKAVEMLKNEFNIDCYLYTAYDKEKNKQPILRFVPSAQEQVLRKFEELSLANINRTLDNIAEGQLGSKSNPFANVDEAADYILKIEHERLTTDTYRQVIDEEQYFYDGVTFRIPWASANVSYYPIDNALRNSFVVNQLETHNKFVLKPSLAYNKFLYRGQSEFIPDVFRVYSAIKRIIM